MAVRAATRRRERRGHERADARLSMRVDARQDDAPRIVTESQNVSASGVYCTSTRWLPPLSKVQITMVLPKVPGGRGGQELVKCDAIVIRCDEVAAGREKRYQLACMFSNLSESQRAHIELFVTRRNLDALRKAAARANGRAPVAAARKATTRSPVRRAVAAPARTARRPAVRKAARKSVR